MNPDEELLFTRSHIEGLERRVFAAEERAGEEAARRAALEVLLVEARKQAVRHRNENVNGDVWECGRDIDPLPWEVEPDADLLVELSKEFDLEPVPWGSKEEEL